MSFFNNLVLKIKRGETPLYRGIRGAVRMALNPKPLRFPRIFRPALRLAYEAHYGVIIITRARLNTFYRHPLFSARCASVGKNLSIGNLPFISGHVEIHIGDDVMLGGNLMVVSGRFLETPKLIIKDRAMVNWNVQFTVNREVVVEEHALISYDCRISDSDGHRREAYLRAKDVPLDPKDIRAVRICRYAWIGNGSHIMKGVTIGEGAIVAANSVVINDIPPYCLAMGNPAEVYFRNFGRPSKTGAAPPVLE